MVELVVFLPFIAAILSGALNRKIPEKYIFVLNSLLVSVAAILSYFVFYNVIYLDVVYKIKILSWFTIGKLAVDWSIHIDSIAAVMLIVVNTVSALVHIYSIGYMSHDKSPAKFMCYISLFTFFMLVLVVSENIVQLFVGWEGVGLCSYLLIGFWYKKEAAYKAAIKAFIVNRVADVFFALGIFAIFKVFDTVIFSEIFNSAALLSEHSSNIFSVQIKSADLICILLFIGCMGKSAQIIFHTWLPDAMEGPTPVSALIHAATMVTAGVFLVARCSPIFEYSVFTLEIITFIGATTALFASIIAITQKDIKKIIAYSTCSQLGYMFFACGVSSYSLGIFHLMTHAFFKALLFLGAGSVIHAIVEEQNIFRMGGLRKKIPCTYALMIIGSWAIAGLPPFAGYFSKDAILEAAYASPRLMSTYAYICGSLAAFCTALYSWRLLILVFDGEVRGSKEVYNKAHESPLTMMVPMSMLAIGAMFAGVLGDKMLGMVSPDLSFWHSSIEIFQKNNVLEKMHHISLLAKMFPLILSVLGIALAYILYTYKKNAPVLITERLGVVYIAIKKKCYFDEFYAKIFIRPYAVVTKFLYDMVDNKCIDSYGPLGFTKIAKSCSRLVCRIQTGLVYHYAFVIFFSMFLLLTWIILIIL